MSKTLAVLLFAIVIWGAACSGPKPLPKGPPPEYEDEPVATASAAPSAAPSAVP